MINRTWLLGGAAVAALGTVYYVMNRGGGDDAGTSYPVPMVIGSGAPAASPSPSGASTDQSISQLLQGQLALATVNQQTQLQGFQTQKDLASMGYASAKDLATLDLAKSKSESLTKIWTSIFGGGGAGSLNVEAPSFARTTQSSWASKSSSGGGGGGIFSMFFGAPPSSSSEQSSSSYGAEQSSGAGYTQGSIYGNIGFDEHGNIAVDINRKTASSLTPLTASQPVG